MAENFPLAKLRAYAAKATEASIPPEATNADEDYGKRINRSLISLQKQVKQHEAALEKLRATAPATLCNEPSHDPKERLQQLHTITVAYKTLSTTEPLLPLSDSPLPALLALRSTLNLVDQTKNSITETAESIAKACVRLRQEEQDLRDACELTETLERKIEKLRIENELQSQKTPEELAKAMMQQQQQKKKHYMAELRNLVKAFNTFVDEHLATMIAAEDLGGPVVGDIVEIDKDALKAGFNQQGKARKTRSDSDSIDARRKRRNKEMWGSGDDDSGQESRSEKEAAGADFRSLTEDLLNAAAGDEGSNPHVKLRRESAAVRFLIRVKVAQFHPEDARKLQLVDFGKELET